MQALSTYKCILLLLTAVRWMESDRWCDVRWPGWTRNLFRWRMKIDASSTTRGLVSTDRWYASGTYRSATRMSTTRAFTSVQLTQIPSETKSSDLLYTVYHHHC